ncbi:hypothetical protein NMY22_g19525 [Coprinellus aureogranulatus]|nr:hypothetical protein NMY22_g19525 [Coprinellus aureogranulatus]
MERLSTECVTLLDPFGARQKILRADTGDIESIAHIVLNRYHINPWLRRLLEDFVRDRIYEMTMDDGHEIRSVTVKLLSSMDQGATVVMSVIVMEQIYALDELSCPLCHEPMPTSLGERTLWQVSGPVGAYSADLNS